MTTKPTCRGRLAPSPTGYLHLGHARTFMTAWQRVRAAGGTVILRVEDIDTVRCKAPFHEALEEDLRWIGLDWDEGPDLGGPHAPYEQSRRKEWHREVLHRLQAQGVVYPCRCSRRELLAIASAPHEGEDEPLYPGTCRHEIGAASRMETRDCHWRFRVPDGEELVFFDERLGEQRAICGRDFGDFVVWRRDDLPAYQLAVVADDAAMAITEVVRGEDLLRSTFRQLLLYRALGWEAPRFYHTPLLCDPVTGQRLAKRHASLSLRELRAAGADPTQLFRKR